MQTAKLFRHGGSQAVRLPKAFRFEGVEVFVQRRGSAVVLTPKPERRPKTLREVAQLMRQRHPAGADFPSLERPKVQQERDLNLD